LIWLSYKSGLTASLVTTTVVRLIGFFASPKIVHTVRDEMAEFVLPLRKEIIDSLTRQGMQWRLRRKGLAKREKEEQMLHSERASKQVLTVKKHTHLILQRACALVTMAISAAPDRLRDGGFHCKSMCTQTEPAHIPHNRYDS